MRWWKATMISLALAAAGGAGAGEPDPTPWVPLAPASLGYRGAREVDALPSAGGRWARIPLPWSRVEPTRGKRDWRSLDAEVRELQDADLRPLPVLQALSEWAGSSEQIYTARDAAVGHRQSWLPLEEDAWVAFVADAVERYDGDGEGDMPDLRAPVLDWQLEHEYPRSWSGTPDEYVRCARLTREGMKRADPRARLAMAGLVSEQVVAFAVCDGRLDAAGLEVGGRRISRAIACDDPAIRRRRPQVEAVIAAGGGGLFDALDVHLYGDWPSNAVRIAWARDRAREAGYDPAIWVLEGGGPYLSAGETYSPEAEADYLVPWALSALAAGAERVAYRFAPPTGKWGKQFRNLGLVDGKGRPKPAFEAYRVLASEVEGAEAIRPLAPDPPIHGFELRRGDEITRVLWSDEPMDLRLPWPGDTGAALQGVDGTCRRLEPVDRHLVAPLGRSPVFVAPTTGR